MYLLIPTCKWANTLQTTATPKYPGSYYSKWRRYGRQPVSKRTSRNESPCVHTFWLHKLYRSTVQTYTQIQVPQGGLYRYEGRSSETDLVWYIRRYFPRRKSGIFLKIMSNIWWTNSYQSPDQTRRRGQYSWIRKPQRRSKRKRWRWRETCNPHDYKKYTKARNQKKWECRRAERDFWEKTHSRKQTKPQSFWSLCTVQAENQVRNSTTHAEWW